MRVPCTLTWRSIVGWPGPTPLEGRGAEAPVPCRRLPSPQGGPHRDPVSGCGVGCVLLTSPPSRCLAGGGPGQLGGRAPAKSTQEGSLGGGSRGQKGGHLWGQGGPPGWSRRAWEAATRVCPLPGNSPGSRCPFLYVCHPQSPHSVPGRCPPGNTPWRRRRGGTSVTSDDTGVSLSTYHGRPQNTHKEKEREKAELRRRRNSLGGSSPVSLRFDGHSERYRCRCQVSRPGDTD